MKTKEFNGNKEKFLCYCSKITYKRFEKELFSNSYSSLENLCFKLNLARHCAACLPNIEDEFFQLKGNKHKIKKIFFKNEKYNLKEKLKYFIDTLFGKKLISQHGDLPMLASGSIKTWLVISNESPSFMRELTVPYKIKLLIFSKSGELVNNISKFLKPNASLKLCLNNYVGYVKGLTTYYVKVTKTPTERGFKGSTRPHFYYEAKSSMATLHTQHGANKDYFIKLAMKKNNDRNFIFIINPNNKYAKINSNIKNKKIEKLISIPSKGSFLQEIKEKNDLEWFLFKCSSNIPVKCYYIIADKMLENLSVDHI